MIGPHGIVRASGASGEKRDYASRVGWRLRICIAALAAAALAAAPAGAAKPRFEAGPPADFLRNHRGRSFRNVINQIGLGPDDRYPGLDLLRPPADLSAPGIYVWPSD